MTSGCRDFREHLESALRGAAPKLGELGWHEHLLACAACRELLEAEEALEALLDSLPAPKLPPALAERVLACLVHARGDALDRLLDIADPARAVPGLSTRVLARLDGERREAALDRLLAHLPEPIAPADLAAHTLRALRADRVRPGRRPRLVALAAAALVLVAAVLWVRRLRSPEPIAPQPRPMVVKDTGTPAATETEEFLASLELLENWDLLQGDDLDLMLSGVSPEDEVLLDMLQDLEASDPAPAPATPSKG